MRLIDVSNWWRLWFTVSSKTFTEIKNHLNLRRNRILVCTAFLNASNAILYKILHSALNMLTISQELQFPTGIH